MKIALAALAAGILAWGSPARAQIYTDYSAWAAAVEDIEPYTGSTSFPATEQTYISTALGGCAFSIAPGPFIETPTDFFVMSFPGNCNEAAGDMDTAVLEAYVLFPFDTFFGVVVGPDVVVNGFNVGDSTFGVIGMSDLHFTVTESGTDNGDYVSFGYGLVIASPRPVPEPAAIALLGIGLFGIGMARRRA